MVAKIEHPCFPQPSLQDSKLWRYSDFTKFIDLLSTKSLFFSRSDLLGDSFEGSYSRANIKLRPHVYKDLGDNLEEMMSKRKEFSKWIRSWTYCNCWHMNEYESAAMWKLYSKSNEAIAVQTKYNKLVKALPGNVYIGKINYINYQDDWIPEGNILYPFMHKRKSFEHENEIRAIIPNFPNKNKEIFVGKLNNKKGLKVEININEVIEAIYVSPNSHDWYYNLVKEVIRKYGYSFNVYKSNLDLDPVY